MDDATIIDFAGRDGVTDPLTELLRKGARELLQVAIEAERDTFLAEFAERLTADGRGGQRVSSGTRRTNWDRACHGESSEGQGQGRQASDLSLCACAALRAQSQIHRSRAALTLPQGHLDGRDGIGAEDAFGPGSDRFFCKDNLEAKRPMGCGIQRLA